MSRVWPDNLIGAISEVVNKREKLLIAPEFRFEMTAEAAHQNLCILRKYKNDLSIAIKAQKDTPLEYGSEFRATNILEKIFRFHPNWKRLQSMLEN
eukprot:166183-Ditylum_brightwellii.AAC.1